MPGPGTGAGHRDAGGGGGGGSLRGHGDVGDQAWQVNDSAWGTSVRPQVRDDSTEQKRERRIVCNPRQQVADRALGKGEEVCFVPPGDRGPWWTPGRGVGGRMPPCPKRPFLAI